MPRTVRLTVSAPALERDEEEGKKGKGGGKGGEAPEGKGKEGREKRGGRVGYWTRKSIRVWVARCQKHLASLQERFVSTKPVFIPGVSSRQCQVLCVPLSRRRDHHWVP